MPQEESSLKRPANRQPKAAESGPEREELTRREWLLRLGGTATLLGFRGAAGAEPAAVAAPSPPDQSLHAESRVQALPPGLYDPSSDHMTHALTSEERFHPVPAGSETDFIVPRHSPYEPQFFAPPEFRMVERLVELMLGEETGHGQAASTGPKDADAIGAEIAEWIDLVVLNSAAVRKAARQLSPQHRALAVRYNGAEAIERLETDDPQKTWREGLTWLAKESQQRYGKAFLDLGTSGQTELLMLMSDDQGGKIAEHAGTLLFALLKAETVRGFYTSQRGLKELNYRGNSFYAECPGCEGHNHS